MILPKIRDPRFITVRRGGTLQDDDHRLLAIWAADCAEHVIHHFEQARPGDDRPRRAIGLGRAWARGEIAWAEARTAAGHSNAAARDLRGAARHAAYAAGQAAAVGHVAAHELGAAAYAIRAVQAAAPEGERAAAGRVECAWQHARLPAEIRDLVLDDGGCAMSCAGSSSIADRRLGPARDDGLPARPGAHGAAATMAAVTESMQPSYRLTEEQMLLRDAVRTLADERVAPRAKDIDQGAEFPQDLRALLASQDILALPFPAAYGGLDADLLTVCLAVEQLSRACATTGLILAVHELASLPIVLAGSPEQRQRWLPRLASGEHLIAFAMTEAEAGSDVGSIRTRAVRDGDDYVITGSKRFISHGSVADLLTVFAVTDQDPEATRHTRLSCFVVEVPTPGFEVARIEHKMGLRGSPTAELTFDAVRVPVANLIGAEGDGFGIAMRTFDRSRPGIAAQAVGIAQGALEAATAYARDRRQFGQRIGDLQMVAAMLADMDAATESARQLLYKACVEIDAGSEDASRWAAMCKLVAGDAAMRVTTDAVQVLGGYGYIDEYPVERMMRDAKITQLYEGTQQIQRLVVARALLGKSD